MKCRWVACSEVKSLTMGSVVQWRAVKCCEVKFLNGVRCRVVSCSGGTCREVEGRVAK